MLLETIAAAHSVDPISIPLWATVALAAGMYPIGIMLGSQCSPCCNCGCPPGEELPDAVLVSFSGLTQSALRIDDLLSLSISSCFGSGASGTVSGAGGLPNQGGQITGVSLASGGSGYAVLGRVEPTGLAISASEGTGAGFSISLTESADDCGLPFWEIASVTVTKAGEGYSDNQQLLVSLGQDEFEALPASLSLQTSPSEPTLSAEVTATDGTGLQLSLTTKIVSSIPNRWGVDTVSVVNGGSGYGDKQPVMFTPRTGETTAAAAVAVVRVSRVQPNVAPHYYGSGTGATFTPTLTKTTVNGDDIWEVTSVSASGGSGYVDNEFVIFFSDTIGEINETDSYWKIVTNGSGAVSSLTKVSGGQFWAPGGVVTKVEVSDPGSYYGASTAADAVTVLAGGRYYKERSDIAAHVAPVTATVSQTAPSAGAGAVLSVTVDDNPASPTFGQVTAVAVDSGGDGYLEWSYTVSDQCCVTLWNGKTALAKRTSPTSCDYSVDCCQRGTVYVRYNGTSTKPTAKILNTCGVDFSVTTTPPYSCDNLTFTATDPFGTGTMSVTPAQASDKQSDYPCPACCNGADDECSQEACLSAGGVWWDQCSCATCDLSQCHAVEVIVDATISITIENPPCGLPRPAIDAAKSTETHNETVTLTHANGWSAGGDYLYAYTYGCSVNVEMCVDQKRTVFTTVNDANGQWWCGAACSGANMIPLPTLSGDACPVSGAAKRNTGGAPRFWYPFGATKENATGYWSTVVTQFLDQYTTLEVSITVATTE